MNSLSFPRAAARAAVCAIAIGGLVAGCASAPSGPVATASATPQSEASPSASIAPAASAPSAVPTTPPTAPKGIPLEVGMTPGDVEKLLGEPLEIQPMDVNGVKAEVLVYHRRVDVAVREVTTGMREVPYVDPVSGLSQPIKEPIIGYVTETNEVELKLLVFQGKVVNWRETVIGHEKHYN